MRRAPTHERSARALLSRLAEPYDDKVQALVQQIGVVDLVGRVAAGDPLPGGLGRERFQARWHAAAEIDEQHIAAALGLRLLVPGDEEWPEALDDLPTPPWCLWVRGPLRLDQVTHGSVALVGARASSAYGDEVAATLAFGLAERGHAVVSGAAYGIDTAAHRAALAAGGATVAVLAGGADVPYPRASAAMLATIGQVGAIVSETPPGGAPARMRFLSRNRIIAALAAGTVVVEAGLRSGARSTVKHARELGRHVMAVPGPVTSQVSAGSNQELRAGAEVVTDAEEIIEIVGRLGVDLAPYKQGGHEAADDLDPQVRRVWQWLRPRSSVSLDDVVVRAGLGVGEVLAALGELEARGLAEQLLDGWQRRGGR